MENIKIRKRKEKKLIGNKTKHYIVLGIIACCLAIGLNIHPNNQDFSTNTQEMIYVFHDYEKNAYIFNDGLHGSADELEYIFNDSIPNNLKGEDNNSNIVSLKDLENDDTYNAQITIEEIMNELGIENEYSGNILIVDEPKEYSGIDENTLIINLSNNGGENQTIENEKKYNISESGQTLTIIKSRKIVSLKNRGNFTNSNYQKNKGSIIKSFESITESRILPTLTPLDKLNNLNNNTETYKNSKNHIYNSESYKIIGGVNILPDYADCMTPWGYKISHGESVLAYKQTDNTPNVCNIERRYCRNGKLSGTYSQQGCSIKGNNTYTTTTKKTSNTYAENQRIQESSIANNNTSIKLDTQQNNDGSVTVYKPETNESFVFDKPNKKSTEFHRGSDNIKTYKSIGQTEKEYKNCITPRGEEVQHGQIVQAFKHANGFYDIPCETQIRLCSMGKLNGSYTQKSCRSRESSFSSRFNGGANKDEYYEKKLKKIKQKIENEETYYNEIKGLSEEEALDKIFYRLDE